MTKEAPAEPFQVRRCSRYCPSSTRENGEVIALLSMQLYVITALQQLERDAGKFTRDARQASNLAN